MDCRIDFDILITTKDKGKSCRYFSPLPRVFVKIFELKNREKYTYSCAAVHVNEYSNWNDGSKTKLCPAYHRTGREARYLSVSTE